ncbi:hypothetical protein EV356DRAFT_500878 [Viridothelium virens]|uniref:Uncharacterized protein n=1 Tax=Viridothelium virens TaxID=1048519 RepID=A0A6A6HA58_VIRVR|nr:hypothetical protein EV356DRAFT_500878 [Viridothelium virens]
MSKSTCPFPAVQEALAPYIHDRSETLRIRKQLDRYLFAPFESNDGSGGAHLAHAFYPQTINARDIPLPISGVRRSYLKALQAHIAAKTKLEELRSDLEELKHGATHTINRQTDSKRSGSIEDYVSLLRLRQRQRRLEVVRNYLATLTTDTNDMKMGLRNAVKQAIGDHPEAPAPMLNNGNEDVHSDELVTKLKKAVLVAKCDTDGVRRADDAQKDGTASTKPDIDADIRALRHARDELISWIEEQLAKVPEETSMHKEDDAVVEKDEPAARTITLSDIEDQYKSYTSSRESLIRFIESIDNASTSTLLSPSSPTKRTFFSRQSPKISGTSPTSATRQPIGAPKEPSQAVTLLPYIPALTETSRTSQALLSQNAFLRRQLASAEDERKATLERLAQESHLLPSSAQAKVSSWNQAAAGARKEMRDFVNEKVSAGERALTRCIAALNDVDEERRAVGSLQGDA